MIQIKHSPELFVASASYQIEEADDVLIAQITQDFEARIRAADVVLTEPSQFYVVFHVEEYREKDYTISLWQTITRESNKNPQVDLRLISAGEVIFIRVDTDYTNLELPYRQLFQYAQENGYKIGGYPREQYFESKEAPLGYYTEIQLPILE